MERTCFSAASFIAIWVSIAVLSGCAVSSRASGVTVTVKRPVIPVLSYKEYNPVIRLDIKSETNGFVLHSLTVSTERTVRREDIAGIALYASDKKGYIDTTRVLASVRPESGKVRFREKIPVEKDSVSLWVSVTLKNKIGLNNRIAVDCEELVTDRGKGEIVDNGSGAGLRPGVAVRRQGQDGIVSSRIPGLVTAKDGALLAVYDARRDVARDLQGNIDIALQRSFDKGVTWQPVRIIMDMGEWGNLPRKFNGVSDACILLDEVSGDIWVAGLWMHGVLDKETGEWIEGLTEESDAWSHQWRGKGSQPGTGVKETSQFLLVRSRDNGRTWSEPVNLTRQLKRPGWWLYAPAPGHGITLKDGTLVFPTQGRDENGLPFSTIAWSKDRGRSWHTGAPAWHDVTECMAVELADGSIMLNMRDNRNRKDKNRNGRRICVTSDLGKTWTEHPTSRKALPEPTCMGSLHRHVYQENGRERSLLLFCNPDSRTVREKITLRVSLDDGQSWLPHRSVLLDEYRGWGYSCITSVDENTVGILYESSQAQLVYQQVKLDELIDINTESDGE